MKYGVRYEISYGEHAEFQRMQFFWKRREALIDGPVIIGDHLRLEFVPVKDDPVSELLVTSDTRHAGSSFALFKLNFDDPTRPAFELVAYRKMRFEYPPPWSDFYESKEEAPSTVPIPNGNNKP